MSHFSKLNITPFLTPQKGNPYFRGKKKTAVLAVNLYLIIHWKHAKIWTLCSDEFFSTLKIDLITYPRYELHFTYKYFIFHRTIRKNLRSFVIESFLNDKNRLHHSTNVLHFYSTCPSKVRNGTTFLTIKNLTSIRKVLRSLIGVSHLSTSKRSLLFSAAVKMVT